MAIIPAPKTHSDVAMNQHLIPRCYMKAWKHNSGNDPKSGCLIRVWVIVNPTRKIRIGL